MIKRPLAIGAVVFVIVLLFLSLIYSSIFWRDPVKTNAEGEKQIAGFLQDDTIWVYGVVSDYDYNDRYGQMTTEIILTDIHILVTNHTKDNSYDNSNLNPNMDMNNLDALQGGRWKKVTRSC